MIDIMKYKTGNFIKAVYIATMIIVAVLLPILLSVYVNVIVGILCTCAVSSILLFKRKLARNPTNLQFVGSSLTKLGIG